MNPIVVRYKLVPFSLTPRQHRPLKGRCPRWVVYAGDNGSVMAYKPESSKWERLGQTWKDPGYWNVTLLDSLKKKKGTNVFDRPAYPVHQLVLLAWKGEPEDGRSTGRHLQGDPDDNRPGQLDWGSSGDNADDATRHKGVRNKARWSLLGYSFNLRARSSDWLCVVKRYNTEVELVHGKSAKAALLKAMRKYEHFGRNVDKNIEKTWFRTEATYLNIGTRSVLPQGGHSESDVTERGPLLVPGLFVQNLKFVESPA